MINCHGPLVRPIGFHITLALLVVASGLLAAPAKITVFSINVQGEQIEYLTDIDTLMHTPDWTPVSRSRRLRLATLAASLSKPASFASRMRMASLLNPLRFVQPLRAAVALQVSRSMTLSMTLCGGTTRSPFCQL